jgi:hypothetical protein
MQEKCQGGCTPHVKNLLKTLSAETENVTAVHAVPPPVRGPRPKVP